MSTPHMIDFSGLVNSPQYQTASPEGQRHAVNKWARVRLGSVGDRQFRGQISQMFVEQHLGGMPPEKNQQFIEMMAAGDNSTNQLSATLDSGKRAASSFADSAAGLASWADLDAFADDLHITSQKLAMNADIPESVADSLGEFDLGDLTKMDFWTTKGAEQIFVNLPFMATGLGTSAALMKGASGAKSLFAASAAGSAAMTVQESLFEAGTAYNQALEVSGSREKAGEVAFNVFWNNAALLGTTNTGELAATLALGRFIPKAVRGGFKDWLRAGGVAVAGASLEGAQEVVQKYYSDAGVSFAAGEREQLPGFVPSLNDVIEILRTPDGREAFVMGFLMQAGTSAAFNASRESSQSCNSIPADC